MNVLKLSRADFKRCIYTTLIRHIDHPLRQRSPAEYAVCFNIDPDNPRDQPYILREWEDPKRLTEADFVFVTLPHNLFAWPQNATIDEAFCERLQAVVDSVMAAAEGTGWLLPNIIDLDMNDRGAAWNWNHDLAD